MLQLLGRSETEVSVNITNKFTSRLTPNMESLEEMDQMSMLTIR